MLAVLTILLMAAVAYALMREGILIAATTLVNVILAGLTAFMLFEPMADELGKSLAGSALDHMEDAISLFVLFAGTLGVLRLVTTNLGNQELDMPAIPHQVGTVAIGLVAGYFLAGFLVVMISTLPLPEKFLGYEATVEDMEPGLRRYLPPDRVWLGLMQHVGTARGLGSGGTTFDPEGTFPLRYAKKQRIKDAS